mmetsp:Transcript_40862/g.121130  ORF Transcript_40862/g.121130 Transcript_40862/m.121130 type:complete len:324 (+) Transcript_40862:856-1827(+)
MPASPPSPQKAAPPATARRLRPTTSTRACAVVVSGACRSDNGCLQVQPSLIQPWPSGHLLQPLAEAKPQRSTAGQEEVSALMTEPGLARGAAAAGVVAAASVVVAAGVVAGGAAATAAVVLATVGVVEAAALVVATVGVVGAAVVSGSGGAVVAAVVAAVVVAGRVVAGRVVAGAAVDGCGLRTASKTASGVSPPAQSSAARQPACRPWKAARTSGMLWRLQRAARGGPRRTPANAPNSWRHARQPSPPARKQASSAPSASQSGLARWKSRPTGARSLAESTVVASQAVRKACWASPHQSPAPQGPRTALRTVAAKAACTEVS